ncbi:acyl-CoA synthetase (NDP forming) [Pseudomonas citronellolis]|uniref:acetate--CoA ligase family protein n=1 Tax=Pseudomonas citronellolis TaxID=53408 RepID=UPI00209CEE30|nr:acetate--CoA ligase family protein [Pseudomonas citronellolis]MCP1645000.1 acyl-CoA synthetase (NDP forming) [Pseudomonas citronellolis]MCP1668000.1 acyl-CoA synthetase (NDP forming) [Pseudomonas citronellolis]MCP1699154.1 acyl-CoA synthetase (NDP forming) [Pseudomonas citronellolis]MCP1705685.1 acyl-CoA synthetase (NDP forming) [Pseudomonas citronellolis]MCP1799718.1 acyl-CoA synthetase (NDP forming) [Pseudomonas citronellolis]
MDAHNNKHTGRALARALLSPRSIALVGASDDPSKTAGRPLQFIRRAGYEGVVYAINPNRETVQGERAWRSLADLPEVPEHAFILTPTDAAIDALEACAELGVPVATILAAGFSEAGPEGQVREQRVRDIVERTGIRVLGPSGLGMVNLRSKLALTANAAFAEPDLPVGGIFVASHSGSMIGGLLSRGKAKGIGFAGLVSVGNEVDLSIGEICAATLDDPEIKGYMLFLETLRHAQQLRAFAVAAAERGKPVVAYKLGRSDAAAELAVSHTGALAGEDDVADTFLKDCGIARFETLEGFLEGLPLVQRLPLKQSAGLQRPPRVAVVTTTGGGAAMVVDQLGIRHIEVQQPSEETYARLAKAGVETSHGRIVDLTLAGTRYEIMSAALGVLRSAPEFDLVIAVAGSSARFAPELVVRPIIDSGAETSGLHPLAAFVVPEAPEALLRLTEAGVPCFRTPEACADALAAAYARRFPRASGVVGTDTGVGNGQLLDELEAYALLARLDVPHAPATAISTDANAEIPAGLPYPLAVKVLSAAVPHKTDAGGVELGIADASALHEAIGRIRDNVQRYDPDLVVDRVLVQPMTKGIGEALVGYRLDPEVGPLVMLAAGGVMTEIYRDRALRLAPVDRRTALDMIAEVKGLKALAGYRGKAKGDLEALADLVVAISNLATLPDVRILEAEVNPVMVLEEGQGAIAVDALVKRMERP